MKKIESYLFDALLFVIFVIVSIMLLGFCKKEEWEEILGTSSEAERRWQVHVWDTLKK